MNPYLLVDPVRFTELVWPEVRLYDKQAEIMYSVRDNKETFVPAGNGLGKDFVSALIAIWFFCSRRPARVVTTSVKHDQLNDVLWGEIRHFLDTAAYPLPIQYNHMHIRQVRNDGRFVPKSELVGQVIAKGEALLGRHLERDIPRTLTIFDEASGIDSAVYESSDTWTHRKLVIGNPYPCSNFFKEGVKAGDAPNEWGPGLRRKVIRIRAEDSPNVQYARAQIAAGVKPDNTIIIPGLVDWETYSERRKVWSKLRQCIGLDAAFPEGAENLLFPPDWLNAAETWAEDAPLTRKALGIGVDTAQGGDMTVWTAVDEWGLIAQVSERTPNTALIPGKTKAFALKYGIGPGSAWRICFDAGGGGKEHADRMRMKGWKVRTISFGGAATTHKPYKANKSKTERTDEREVQYVYKNRRAELYGLLRQAVDPQRAEDDEEAIPFTLPHAIVNRKRPDGGPSLREQLEPMPYLLNEEGMMWLPPKRKKDKNDKRESLEDILGCSPDEADSLVLAHFGMKVRPSLSRIAAA